MDTGTSGDILGAMRRICAAAAEFMDERDAAGLGWSEESVTDVAIGKGLPQIRAVQFNRQQEGRGVGADYLWWWLDGTSEDCFGMLVQAKRLDLSGAEPKVDITHGGGKQLGDLMRTAHTFEVPAMYSIYTGGPHYRRDLPCFHGGEPDCLGCRRMAILLICAIQVWSLWEFPASTAEEVLNSGIALENLLDPELVADIDYVLPPIGSLELRQWLVQPQIGPREVAKRIFAEVNTHRLGAFSAMVAEPMTLPGQMMFPDVPQDRGHFPVPYFEHVLRGLRHSPPSYVADALEQRALPPELTESVDGLVIVQL